MRIALGIEYNGHGFYGWQAQPGLPTIEGSLQAALTKVANEPIYLACGGRTDSHVHAYGQVVHFDTQAKRHVDAWIWGTNTHLPAEISVRWAKAVDYHFHARFSALSRRYQYIIYNHPIRPAIWHKHVTWYAYPLDVTKMQLACSYLLGEQDFSSFRSAQCQSKTAMRCIQTCHLQQHGAFIIIDIKANAFLHHMVRNIVGVLLKIGAGFQPPGWMEAVLLAKDRRAAAETASPYGLYLAEIAYPAAYSFPTPRTFFDMIGFLPD